MMISAEVKGFQDRKPLTAKEADEAKERRYNESLQGAIPPRYRNGRGGIDLDRVRRDQRHARQQVIRAMMRNLKELWHRD
jgi:hypothetical protein